jgi:NAD(P)H-hydrate repair Nnr-like enzyme with NAD(P)H-hydrate dehydratase domain
VQEDDKTTEDTMFTPHPGYAQILAHEHIKDLRREAAAARLARSARRSRRNGRRATAGRMEPATAA